MANKFLNQDGVSILWDRINNKFATKTELQDEVKSLQEQISALQPDDGSGNAELLARIQANEEAIATNTSAIETLNADEGEGSVAKIASDIAVAEIAKVVAGADESFDTLKEIADWIANDTTGSTQMANDIAALQEAVGTKVDANAVATAIEEALKVEGVDKYALATDLTALADRVTTLEGVKIEGLTQAEIEAVTPLA